MRRDKTCANLFNRNRFCKISGLVYVKPLFLCRVIGNKLCDGCKCKRTDKLVEIGDYQSAAVGQSLLARDLLGADQYHVSAARDHLVHGNKAFLCQMRIADKGDHGHAVANKRDRSVLQLARRVRLAVYIGYFL